MRFFSLLAIVFIATLTSCQEAKVSVATAKAEPITLSMETTHGNLVIELSDLTPLHRDNFLNLAQNGAFDGLLFHRVIENFMIQGGDPDSKNAEAGKRLGEGDAPYMVAAEMRSELFHQKGALAAARDNNPEKSSSAMQFYIVQGKVQNDSLLSAAEIYTSQNRARDYFTQKSEQQELITEIDTALYGGNRTRYRVLMDSILSLAKTKSDFTPYVMPENYKEVYKSKGGYPRLDQNYTVFGQVVEGLAVIDSIAAQTTDDFDRPLTDVMIKTVRIIN